MVDVLVSDERERLDGLRARLSPDFVYVGPDAVFDGADGLSEAFARYRHDRSLAASLRRTSPVDQHHGWFRSTWARMERGRDRRGRLGHRFPRRRRSDSSPGRLRGSRARPARRPRLKGRDAHGGVGRGGRSSGHGDVEPPGGAQRHFGRAEPRVGPRRDRARSARRRRLHGPDRRRPRLLRRGGPQGPLPRGPLRCRRSAWPTRPRTSA